MYPRRRILILLSLALAGPMSCARNPTSGSEGTKGSESAPLQYTATIEHSVDGIRAAVTVRSPDGKVKQLETAATCMPALVIASDTGGSPQHRWDQQSWFNSRIGGCKWMPAKYALPTIIRTPITDAATILGDSLSAGTYQASVRLINAHFVETSPGSYAGVIDAQPVVPAGPITLTR